MSCALCCRRLPQHNLRSCVLAHLASSTAAHTQEAEIVSAATSLRAELIPLQQLLQLLLGRPVNAVIHEDNEACITAIRKGYSPTLRHILRTQRILLARRRLPRRRTPARPPTNCAFHSEEKSRFTPALAAVLARAQSPRRLSPERGCAVAQSTMHKIEEAL